MKNIMLYEDISDVINTLDLSAISEERKTVLQPLQDTFLIATPKKAYNKPLTWSKQFHAVSTAVPVTETIT